MYPPKSWKPAPGLTLAELLIALAILGVLATMSIPKIISAQQNNTFKAIAKEDIAAIAAAHQKLQLSGGLSQDSGLTDLTQYLNYVNIDTSGALIDDVYTLSTIPCTSSQPCIVMPNGSKIVYWTFESFGGTTSNRIVSMVLDPDGKVTTSSTTGPGKSIDIFLFYNGRIAAQADVPANSVSSCCNNFGWSGNSAWQPPWFSW